MASSAWLLGMKRLLDWLWFMGLLLLGLNQTLAQATIEGTVSLPKPPREPVPLPRYPNQLVQPAAPDPPVAVVYLEGQFPVAAVTNAPRVTVMGQRHFQFTPGLLPIQKGTLVEFPNQDDFYHNVFSYSKTKRFDLGRYRKEEKPAAQLFDKTGLVKLNCEIHEHMRGLILVLDTPHFRKTDTNGQYRLENLPPGQFVLKAWLNEKTVLERPVDLKAGETLRVDFKND